MPTGLYFNIMKMYRVLSATTLVLFLLTQSLMAFGVTSVSTLQPQNTSSTVEQLHAEGLHHHEDELLPLSKIGSCVDAGMEHCESCVCKATENACCVLEFSVATLETPVPDLTINFSDRPYEVLPEPPIS
ncbi:hypothetical protein Selin_0037 [Desulfurispirillum indicum S5]|uniref:Uncharacterized protein n=2 Tax=Desulfurispirillum TaxID=393029 RepID=E6W4R8_DESIS|nr:hypothetical protein Selin_0037 [Desulfurispirillum indicum S5]